MVYDKITLGDVYGTFTKVIAASGYTSRRKAEELIKAGKVYVNGKIVTELGTKVSGNDDIVVNGVHLERRSMFISYLINLEVLFVQLVMNIIELLLLI